MQIKVRVERNQVVISTAKQSRTFKASQSYSYPRMVVGDFQAAERCVKEGAQAMGLLGFFKGKHHVRVEVRDYFGDGIMPVERQLYRELVGCLRIEKFELEVLRG